MSNLSYCVLCLHTPGSSRRMCSDGCMYHRVAATMMYPKFARLKPTRTDGADVTLCAQQPLQGNYRALLALLDGRPDLCTTEVLGDCADAMFDSSCYACVRGGPKCQRCTNEDR